MITENQTFEAAMNAMEAGLIVSHQGLPVGSFVFRQVPSEVSAAVIPKMSSLPDSVKAELIKRGGNIRYVNQWCLVLPTGSIHGWHPALGGNWLEGKWTIHHSEEPQKFPVAPVSETAGTGTPLPAAGEGF